MEKDQENSYFSNAQHLWECSSGRWDLSSFSKTQQNQKGGLIDIEAPIHISNCMLVDKKTNRPTRFKVSILKDGTKVRISKKSGEAI